MYRTFFSLVLSRLDPEQAHHLAFDVIRTLPKIGIGHLVARATRPHPSLAVQTLGLHFPSPFGLAAGFDKDGKAVQGLGQLGFGHIEVGTVTAIAQPGNERPRLFRLIPDRAVINRMGFNNSGAADAAPRLRRERLRRDRPVIGANIGKSRVVDVDAAIEDYLVSARLLAPVADYLAVNVSSPNTPGLRGLQELEKLAPLLDAVRSAAGTTPVLVKIAPDLVDDEVRRIAELVIELGLDGIIATNTTLARSGLRTPTSVVEAAGAGGLSGAPLAARSLAVLRLIRTVVPAELCVISVGGVETAADVAERLDAGATLVQGYTAFLYRGPLWAHSINRGLRRLRRA
ncbi:quinone-dependent dihydroorotate dehydrogenase [Lacisediminihabitans changchengi]|uniref:Dihydroorotate dehydrogenase (quinone) n=1 Tax=Lacisediminihabitans changchengi TaxID=2787634 RepID=A0A934SLX6_9MICO|nr:quinone-dependent dihydroorotate dehydrogenase [Lacisediminihabitans changchengi]MBK4347770.1 quinone-dependent dihydroorotate dehydrogenase [Lacisediminihabitans changchengi]